MSIHTLKPGRNPPDEINVVLEIPKGSSIKYEIDPKSGRISVDRILFPAIFYPCNYGFIPQTKEEQRGDDGAADPIDVFILGNSSLLPKSVISCRPTHFIERHKDLEKGKYVKVAGWEGKDTAKIMISEAIKRYNMRFDF